MIACIGDDDPPALAGYAVGQPVRARLGIGAGMELALPVSGAERQAFSVVEENVRVVGGCQLERFLQNAFQHRAELEARRQPDAGAVDALQLRAPPSLSLVSSHTRQRQRRLPGGLLTKIDLFRQKGVVRFEHKNRSAHFDLAHDQRQA